MEKRLEEWLSALKINKKYHGLLMVIIMTAALDSAMGFDDFGNYWMDPWVP
jgi:hypothetical protein